MKKLIACAYLLVLSNPIKTFAITQTPLLIAEVQTESIASASDEFIKIVNSSTSAVDLTGWSLQYYSAASDMKTPSRTIALNGSLQRAEFATASSSSVAQSTSARWTYAPTLAAAGGHVVLVGPNGQDVLGWGTAVHPESAAADIVARGKTYKRQKNANGSFIDTQNNKKDFAEQSSAPAPTNASPATNQQASSNTTAETSNNSVEFEITELMADPASPLTDADDEYIELHNTSTSTIDMGGLLLQTGTNFTYSYTLPHAFVPADGYVVLYASTTNLALSNSSSRARIVTSSGATVSETAAYEKAQTGKSWSLIEGSWRWATPSPQKAATITDVQTTESDQPTSGSTKSSKSTTKKATTTKTTAGKKDGAAASTTPQPYTQPSQDNKVVPVNPFILAGLGVFALGYMLYEYRSDFARVFTKRRRNRSIS